MKGAAALDPVSPWLFGTGPIAWRSAEASILLSLYHLVCQAISARGGGFTLYVLVNPVRILGMFEPVLARIISCSTTHETDHSRASESLHLGVSQYRTDSASVWTASGHS